MRKSHSISKKLSTYFREIESSATLIESFTAASSKKGGKAGVDPIQKSLINVRGQLQKAEEKIQELEENVKDAEDAARSVKTLFDREQLANAVQGITIWLVDLLPTFCKPFTQFEAYYVMLCNTSLDKLRLVWYFFETFHHAVK